MTKKMKKILAKKMLSGGLKPLFSFANYAHKRKLNQLVGHSKILMRIFGILIGHFYLRKSSTTLNLLKRGVRLLYPNCSKTWVRKITHSWLYNSGTILADVIFHLPNLTSDSLKDYINYENLDALNREYKKGNGVILASVHTANVFHIVAGLVFHPNKYRVSVVANMENKLLFKQLLRRKELKNLTVVGTSNYESITEDLQKRLN